nr:unnamed protein product [Moritella viscosa]
MKQTAKAAGTALRALVNKSKQVQSDQATPSDKRFDMYIDAITHLDKLRDIDLDEYDDDIAGIQEVEPPAQEHKDEPKEPYQRRRYYDDNTDNDQYQRGLDSIRNSQDEVYQQMTRKK